jgi:hypothetical protein
MCPRKVHRPRIVRNPSIELVSDKALLVLKTKNLNIKPNLALGPLLK